jgi:hypothetical protein
LSLLPKDAAVTFGWRGGEINGHTFDDFIVCHVYYSACAAVSKLTVPGLQVRDALRVVSRGRWAKVQWLIMRDTSRRASKTIEPSRVRHGATDDDLVMPVREPAVLWSECNKVVPITSEQGDRDKVRAARGDKEDIFQGQFMIRGNA